MRPRFNLAVPVRRSLLAASRHAAVHLIPLHDGTEVEVGAYDCVRLLGRRPVAWWSTANRSKARPVVGLG